MFLSALLLALSLFISKGNACDRDEAIASKAANLPQKIMIKTSDEPEKLVDNTQAQPKRYPLRPIKMLPKPGTVPKAAVRKLERKQPST